MGIKQLSKFIADHAPSGIVQRAFDSFTGRIVVIDASMSLYQFMVAIRDAEGFGVLTNDAGETTSHLTGMLSRVVRLMEHGIKPAYVFDGKPPVMKTGELAKRHQRRAQAEKELEEAREVGDKDEIKKFSGRTVKITAQHNADIKKLLRLMGIPVVEAPCEAEAQCAVLAKAGKAFATATEDADALTFGTPVLLRNLNFSNEKLKNSSILEFHLDAILKELGLTMDEFIDFCILCGCDYCDTIRGIGPGTAYRLIQKHKTIEEVLNTIDTSKYTVPESFPYQEARRFFQQPETIDPSEICLSWTEPDYEKLYTFLVEENDFNKARIENYINRYMDFAADEPKAWA